MNKRAVEKLKIWKGSGKADPEKVQIYPTNRCNLKCIFCAQRNENYGYESEVPKKRWLKVTREISQMDVDRILVSGGGEPLCRPETALEIMELVKESGLEGRLITSGTELDRKICKRIAEMKWDTIVFSLDGSKAETHDYLRGREGTFGKVLRNIEILKETKGNGELPDLEINFVVNRKNFEEVPEMMLLADKLGFASINFEPLTVNNPRDRKLKVNEREGEKLRRRIIPRTEELKESENLTVTTNLDTLRKIKMERAGKMKDEIEGMGKERESVSFEDSPCFEPWIWPKIEPNGDVWPCSTTPLHENIKEKDFKEIWYGKVFENFRDKVLNGDLPQSCENCVTTHLKTNQMMRKKLKEI